MTQKQIELAARRGAICARIAAQRQALSYHSGGLSTLLEKGDLALRGIDWMKQNPLAVGVAAAVLAILRPRRAFRWARRGFFLWQGWRNLRNRLLRA